MLLKTRCYKNRVGYNFIVLYKGGVSADDNKRTGGKNKRVKKRKRS
jgi:hypothetical protein